MTSPLPVVQYLVAFNNGPLDDPALITSVASPGALGAVNVWTDITGFVAGHQLDRGRQHELDQFEAGTCTLDLDNADGRFNPWNADGPYYGLLKPRKLLQVRAVWNGATYTRFTGHVNSWPVLWPDPRSQQAQVQASDAFRLFQAADITGAGYAAQVVADGATTYFRLGEPAGSTAAVAEDGLVVTPVPAGLATFGQPGAMVADPTTSVMLTVPGGDGNGVDLTGGTAANSTTGASFEIWVKGDSSAWWGGWLPFGINGSYYWAAFVLVNNQFSVDDYSGSDQQVSWLGVNLDDGNWHHVVITVNTSWDWSLFIDGLQYEVPMQKVFDSVGATIRQQPQLSQTQYVSNTTASNVWFQDWAIYPSPLTPAQVANHYAIAEFVQERTDQRITHVLDTLAWSAGARSLDAGDSVVRAETQALTDVSSLSHMQDCETTEAGALFMTGDGKVRFLARDTLWTASLYQVSQATFGDDPGEVQYQPSPSIALDDLDIYNEASGQRQGGIRIVVDNQPSIAEYGRTTWQPNGTLLGISDLEVQGRLQYVVNNYSEPVTRISSIDVDLLDAVGDDLVAPILALDLLYRVTVCRHGTPDGGTAFEQVSLIERIAETVTVDGWMVTLALDPADVSQQFVWGVSEWGATTKWAF